jgi:mono/diheme cytochrome c family protein
MTEKHEPGMAYDMKKLNKVFAFLSVLLLVTVGWVFLDDYLRPWKKVQIEAEAIKQKKLEEKINEEAKKINDKQLAELEGALKSYQADLSKKDKDIKDANKEILVVLGKIKAEDIKNGVLNANLTETVFKYETAHDKHKPNADELFADMRRLKGEFAESGNRLKELKANLAEKNRKLVEITKSVDDTNASIEKIIGAKERLVASFEKTKTFEDKIWLLRNSPIIDFMDPTLKIHQLVIMNQKDDRYFVQVPKVDRCITCHTFIDQKGYEDQPNPFKSHPKLDLMVGMDSKHPMKTFGCTGCHQGEGHRVTDFNLVVHTPNNEKQEKEWMEKYGWHRPHAIAQPMFRLKDTEGACIKCHQGVDFIPGGTVVNEGLRNIEKFGCYGCHKIKGFEDRRKPAPSLVKVAGKLDKEFFKNWVWSPKTFNKHARMPTFFAQDNNNKPEFLKKNIAEVNAMAEFIYSISKEYSPKYTYEKGNEESGKKLISEIGCLACHGVEGLEEESKKVGAYAGPYLSATGSKIKNPSFLVTWLMEPSHFSPETIMPSMRLTKKEANDITAYLMSLKNKSFEILKFQPLDGKTRDEVLFDYFVAFDTAEGAKKSIEKMSDHERTMELGKRSVGKYGCFGCHTIAGFENYMPIGPELSEEGSKPIAQFMFGHQKVAPTRQDWLTAHLLNPRRWDGGVDVAFKDLLRMPNFYMDKKQAESLVTVLLGMVSDKVPVEGMKNFNANEKLYANGYKVMNKFNCIGCHQIEGEFGDLLKMYSDDINQGPPLLVGQGQRVNADWFYHFLGNVEPIRPWVKVRMPSFNLTNQEKNLIVSGFAAKSNQVIFETNEKVTWAPGEREGAVKLFDQLACTSCHAQGFTKTEPLAPDLHKSNKRLRFSWIKKWLSNPQAIMPQTTMPAFWEGGSPADPDILGGDGEKQITAVAKYVLELGQKGK